MIRQLFQFHGGVKPPTHKAESTTAPILKAPLFAQYVVPLHQSIGGTPRPLVAVGDVVKKGQRIGAADGNVSAAVHAPTSGVVSAVEPRLMAHPSGLPMLSVVIDADGRDEWGPRERVHYTTIPPDELRDILRDAGVVGLGGAVFPSHLKLKPGATGTDTLVINGAECEPFITCDDMLMRERAESILRGAAIMRHMLSAKTVLIGIEDNKPEAIAALQRAVAALGETMQVVSVPTRYPAGGAKQLIRVLTGIEVPHGKRSTDFGVQCFNVGTAAAIDCALNHGEPLISRVVTVAGNVAAPRNMEVLIGTPFAELLRLAGVREDTDRLIMGGPMMGLAMPGDSVPVVKATNCILASSPRLFPPAPPEMPCIRCTACVDVCPADLQPQELYWFARAKNFGKAQEYHLFDCIECGCCAYVCPSHIPLVDYYRFAKTEIWARERDKAAADAARERFESRTERLEREKREKAEKLAAKAGTKTSAAPVADDPKKALIAAAMERARAQREAVQPQNTDTLTPAQAAEIRDIEQRRAQAPSPTPPSQPTQPIQPTPPDAS